MSQAYNYSIIWHTYQYMSQDRSFVRPSSIDVAIMAIDMISRVSFIFFGIHARGSPPSTYAIGRPP